MQIYTYVCTSTIMNPSYKVVLEFEYDMNDKSTSFKNDFTPICTATHIKSTQKFYTFTKWTGSLSYINREEGQFKMTQRFSNLRYFRQRISFFSAKKNNHLKYKQTYLFVKILLHVSKSQYFFSNLNSNCSDLLDMRNLLEQVNKAFCYQELF